MSSKGLCALLLTVGILTGTLGALPTAQAKHYYAGHYDRRSYYGRPYQGRSGLVDYQTGKIIKGGLVGAGIGAGTGLLLDRNVGRSALVGAGLGAGTQAMRYSRTMRRHPVLKTAGYGALTGIGVSELSRGNLGKGALWGGGIGAGLGILRDRGAF